MVTSAEQDYLKAVLALTEGGTASTVTAIAAYLGVSQPSAWTMVKKLESHGQVERHSGAGIVLTPSGRAEAMSVVRRHRLVETFLYRVFHYSLDEIHDEAELVEHAISDRFVANLADFLGHPERDPHGDPIPRPDWSLPQFDDIPLAVAPAGCDLRVVRVKDKQPDVLRKLMSAGLVPGAAVQIVEAGKGSGPIRVVCGPRHHTLSDDLAKAVYVEKL